MRGLADKSGFVTGGASGIGRATAKRLAEEGVDVAVADVDVEGGEETVARIEEESPDVEAKFYELDVTDYDAVEDALFDAADTFGQLDVLFNNAGIGEERSFEDTTIEHRDRLMDVNINGVWNGCHAVLPIMKEQGGGSIINTSSMGGWRPSGITTYGLTKAAVLHFSKSVAPELGTHGIRINAVCPGYIETQMTRTWIPEEVWESAPDRIALGRWAKPEEIASGVAFLASDDASYMTGRALKIDAGFV